jgi:hypothetical protein
MKKDEILYVGTLVEDLGKIGIIVRIIQSGTMDIDLPLIKWRVNYEIYYQDGVVTVMAESTLKRLVADGKVRVISLPS